MAFAGDATTQRLLQLHAHVDRLASCPQECHSATSPTSTLTVASVLTRALTEQSLGVLHRARLLSRLRAALHEGVVDAARDEDAMACWATLLADAKDSDLEARLASTCAGSSWARILSFALSLPLGGLPMVSRGFRHMAFQPSCWSGQDITLEEHHLRHVRVCGDAAWGHVFRLLPAWRHARSLRVAGFADAALRERVLPPLRSACRALGAPLLECSFCERFHGERLELCPRRLTARRQERCPRGGGVLVGAGPLWPRGGARRFSVRIEALRRGERLDIGVTSLSPWEQLSRAHRQVAFAEDLLSSWVVESSGLLVGSHAGLRIRDSRWDARQLCVGDVVGVEVSESGELRLEVNGELRASWRAQIPKEARVYPVVDLFEGSPCLSLLPDGASAQRT